MMPMIPEFIDEWEFYDEEGCVMFYHDGHLQMREMKDWITSIIGNEIHYKYCKGNEIHYKYCKGPSGPFAWCFEFAEEAYIMMKLALSVTQPIAPPRTFDKGW